MNRQPQTFLNCQNTLGEGPLWDNNALWWVDIAARRVYHWRQGNTQFIEFVTPITALGKRQKGGFIVSTGQGFAFWDGASTALQFLENPYPADRFNDGKVSPAGAFWAGTMSKGESAQFFRYAPDGTIQKLEDNLTISNGLGWSPDLKTFYLTDTRKDTIYAYDYNRTTDSISNRRVFIDTTPFDGKPDGLTVDSTGHIWSCMWNGACIRRYDPSGKCVEVISMPVACPTSCTFAGKTLYITSARTADPDNPLAGNLFTLQTDTTGLPDHLFAG